MNNFKDEVIALIDEFLARNRKNPTKLFVTPEKENEMFYLTKEDVGNKKIKDLTVNGPRKTFENNKFLGLEIIWDADEFKVE